MSAHERGEAVVIERVQLRRVTPLLGFANVRISGAHLMGLRIQEQADGRLKCTPPETVGSNGQRWPAWALQPGWREGVEAEIAVLWSRSA